MSTRRVELGELVADKTQGKPLLGENIDLVKNLKVQLVVNVGHAEMTIGELFALKENGIVRIDKDVAAPVEVLLEGKLVARGNLVAVDDNFGVCITEIAHAK